MSIPKLSSAAEDGIKVMLLKPEDENIVRKCISRYTMPDQFCHRLTWAIHRIVNAVKSIFGCSDWQTAKSRIRDNAVEIAIQRGIFQINPENAARKSMQERAINLFDFTASELLDICLDVHQNHCESDRVFKACFDKISIENLMKDLKERADKIFKDNSKPKAA